MQPERISIAFALEAFGADLREAFDVVAHRDEGTDALEKSGDGERAGWVVGRPVLKPETYPCDLAGSCTYRCVERCFVVDDKRLDVEAHLRVVF